MGALDGASTCKLLFCMEQSAALRVLSLTRGIQVRRDTMRGSESVGEWGLRHGLVLQCSCMLRRGIHNKRVGLTLTLRPTPSPKTNKPLFCQARHP